MTLIIDFKNIIKELESKCLKLCFVNNSISMEDIQGNLYVIETYRHGSYLDNLIKNGIIVRFNLVENHCIEEWQKERWNVSKVKDFIERQSPYW